MNRSEIPTSLTGRIATAGILRHRAFPVLLLRAWIEVMGALLRLRTHQTSQPPLNEPLEYMKKAQGVWQAVENGRSFNTFDIAPAHRPPGTVLLSYPPGFVADPRGFYFRSLFIPFLLWTAAILLQKAAVEKTLCRAGT